MSTSATAVAVVREALDRQDVQIEPKDVGHATARVVQAIEDSKTVAVVPVQSSWASSINWTQAIAVLASVLVIFGVNLDAPTQVAVVGAIQGLQAVATWVLRTWFSDSVTPQSAGKG